MDRLDKRLDAQTGAEVERLGDVSRDRADEACDLDGLEIVEADLVARCDDEGAVGWMSGSGLDPAEALAPVPLARVVEVQLVQPFAAEDERRR